MAQAEAPTDEPRSASKWRRRRASSSQFVITPHHFYESIPSQLPHRQTIWPWPVRSLNRFGTAAQQLGSARRGEGPPCQITCSGGKTARPPCQRDCRCGWGSGGGFLSSLFAPVYYAKTSRRREVFRGHLTITGYETSKS
jgi:hypothetical protein